MALLEVDGLNLSIRGRHILKDVGFAIERGKVTGVVGESGSGKSLTALSIMQLLPHRSDLSGSIRFDGFDIAAASEREMCALRGDDIGMVFQEPMTALNPLKTVGEQVMEGIRLHTGATRKEARERAEAILEHVGLPPSQYALTRFPHELSGGQRQRVVIAMACALRPKLLIADEPTTALDVVVQARILDLLNMLVDENDMALMLISHDLGVVSDMADDIVIMRGGEIVEAGPAIPVLKNRTHPYTRQLAEASTHVPARDPDWRPADGEGKAVVSVSNLVCEYPGRRTGMFTREPPFRAVDDVSFDIGAGEIAGLVGESGCGKSTLGRSLLGLMQPSSGRIEFDGRDVTHPDSETRSEMVEFVQAVFQDPFASFNPRHKAGRLVAEPLFLRRELSAATKRDMALEALENVGMHASDLDKYAHEFSGGQRQRLAIARAVVNQPRLIIADEPVSALDVSIRAQVVDLIVELRERLDLAWLFISHDLSVVRSLCDTVMVMRSGRIVERGSAQQIHDNPREEYTRQLVAAAPDLEAVIARLGDEG
ncbi:MAG: ABC transporter ATP-binding protein [Nitratireductor sp.]|nr:ABC transporter ATP-binding protein [Nitratireductor sp.]